MSQNTVIEMIKNRILEQHIRPMTPIPTSTLPAGVLKHDVRCILFDIYGTLFISGSGDISLAGQKSLQIEKIQKLLTKHRIHLTPRELQEQFHDTVKMRHRELIKSGIDFPEVKIDRIWQQVLSAQNRINVRQFAIEFELITNPVFPMPNLADLLSVCRQKELSLGIISNAQFYTPYLFKWFFDSAPEDLGFSPELIFYSYKFEMAKPSTALFELAAEKLSGIGVSRSAVLYLGNDMLNDILPAQKSGFQTALFTGDKRSLRLRSDDTRCRNLKPDVVVTNLKQLIQHLG